MLSGEDDVSDDILVQFGAAAEKASEARNVGPPDHEMPLEGRGEKRKHLELKDNRDQTGK